MVMHATCCSHVRCNATSQVADPHRALPTHMAHGCPSGPRGLCCKHPATSRLLHARPSLGKTLHQPPFVLRAPHSIGPCLPCLRAAGTDGLVCGVDAPSTPLPLLPKPLPLMATPLPSSRLGNITNLYVLSSPLGTRLVVQVSTQTRGAQVMAVGGMEGRRVCVRHVGICMPALPHGWCSLPCTPGGPAGGLPGFAAMADGRQAREARRPSAAWIAAHAATASHAPSGDRQRCAAVQCTKRALASALWGHGWQGSSTPKWGGGRGEEGR